MKQKLSRLPAAFVLLVLGLWAGIATASAISVNPPTFTTLIEGSDSIVQGTVIDRESRWVTNQAGYRVIKTYLTVRVNESAKGDVGEKIVLEFLGGSVGDETMKVGGMPTFNKGDRGWFFVRGNGRYLCPLAFAHHGAYLLEKNPDDGTDRIVTLSGAPLGSTAEIGDEAHVAASIKPLLNRALTSDAFRQAISREMLAIKTREAQPR